MSIPVSRGRVARRFGKDQSSHLSYTRRHRLAAGYPHLTDRRIPKAFAELEGYLAEEKLKPEMKRNIQQILYGYRQTSQRPKSRN